MPDETNYQPMYSSSPQDRINATAPIIGKKKKEPETPKPTERDWDRLPYPPQIRGHMTDTDGKQYVSVMNHNATDGRWIPVGATLESNWKIESIDNTKNQVRLSAYGVPTTIDVGYGVPTGNVDRPYKVVDASNYTAQFQNFTESQHEHFKSFFKNMFDPAGASTFEALRLQALKTIRDSVQQGGGMSSAEQDQFNELPKMNNDYGYDFHQGMMDNIKRNFEAAGNSSENVMTLNEFQEKMANGTAESGKDYLIPKTDSDGNVDFERFNFLPPAQRE